MSAEGFIWVIFSLIIAGLIFWLFWWLIDYLALPEPFNKVARVVLAVVGVLFLVNLLLGLMGKAIF